MTIVAQFTGTQRAGERRQMKTGTITVGGTAYEFRSGGHGKGNLPVGTYTATKHLMNRSDSSMRVGNVGYSFALTDKFDPRVKATRTTLRIHPDGGVPGTEGCIGIVGDAKTQAAFRSALAKELDLSGGHVQLEVRE